MVKESTNGQTQVSTKEIGRVIKYRAMVNTHGTMAEPIRGIGSKITCMGKVNMCGPTAENMRGSTSMTRSMGMEPTIIQMADLTKANGHLANNMARDCF